MNESCRIRMSQCHKYKKRKPEPHHHPPQAQSHHHQCQPHRQAPCIVLSCCLQCVAVSCSVLQCVAVLCSVVQGVVSMLQCFAVPKSSSSMLQCVAVCCSALQCGAECCQYVAAFCSAQVFIINVGPIGKPWVLSWHVACSVTQCSVVQCVAVWCIASSVLQ